MYKEKDATVFCKLCHIFIICQKGDSVTRDWNLVCEREGMKATVGAAPMAGYLLGTNI